MDVLVLGGSRFVGMHLVMLLHSQGHSVTVLSRGQTQGPLPEELQQIVADRSVPRQVTDALRGRRYDALFDISGYRPSEVEPVVEALDGNVGNYVFCSTVAVYAPSETMPISEDSPLDRGPDAGDYSRDKTLCEDMLLERHARTDFPATIIRPPYIYGPHDHITRRLFSIFSRLSLGRRLIAPAEGRALTHAVHVDDLAAAFVAVPGQPEALGEAFTVAGPEAITFNGYVDAIAGMMGVEARVVRVSVREYEEMLEELAPIAPSDIFDYGWRESIIYSTEKVRTRLGWSPRYDTYSGVEMAYRWWLEQGLDREPLDFSADDRALEWLASR